MLISMLIQLVNIATQAVILLVIVSSVLSFFMSPYHQVRQSLDRIVQPMLRPIQRVVPLVGSLDFSPLIFIILVQIVSAALINFLYVLR
jgi:YggT family protein